MCSALHACMRQDLEPKRYSIMYYKNNNSVGIRKMSDPKQPQIFSFGGKNCGQTERALREIGVAVIKKLRDGMSDDAAREWARAKI